jgi:ABC-2 type transport system ATP-binding protein
MLTLGRKLNSRWDDGVARSRLAKLGIPLNRMVGTLSGGQRSQVALVMALAKRPDVLLLDEPVASLDPLARREFLQTLMEAAAESGLTLLLSSHIVADLERVCDYLIILSASHVQLTGDIDRLVETHKLLVSTRRDSAAIAHIHNVIQERHTDRQTTLLVRTNGHIWDPSWEVHDLPLEDIVLAYLSQATDSPQVLSGVTREVLSA